MEEPTLGSQWTPGEVDQLQAADFAERMLDPALLVQAQALSAEFDRLHADIAGLFGRYDVIHRDLYEHMESISKEKARRVMHGIDTDMTYATVERAEQLYEVWSGDEALWARAARLFNLIARVMGAPESECFFPDRIERALADAAG